MIIWLSLIVLFFSAGDDCDVNIDDCLGIDCNNGQCIDNIGSYTCLCSDGFTGKVLNIVLPKIIINIMEIKTISLFCKEN